ncbi:hypothetical protein HDU79_005403 [Rhizoclosmatium sp. JEL0117]|nr:hypothetical protein HDU99_009520 [Rhizoclosmatium hyalinum]KAJ3287803.1 hypothetical protein HDU79_005403 [Rhizoclosmatium sp. JEL0117]
MEDPDRARLRQKQSSNSNPNLDDFMGSTQGSSSGSTRPSAESPETFEGLASLFSMLRASASVQANDAQQQVLQGLIQQLQQEAQQGSTKPPTSKFFLRNLPTAKAPTTPCAICVENFDNDSDDPAKALPCKHIFHKKCITPWLKLHNTCPFCRWELPTDDKIYERGRKERQKVEAKKRGIVLDDEEDDDPMSAMYG